MTTYVCNLNVGGVTTRATSPKAVTKNFEADAAGLYAVGGSPPPSSFSMGLQLEESSRRARARYIYFFGAGLGAASAVLATQDGNTYTYPVTQRRDRVFRAVLGAGLRGNYFRLTINNTSAFELDRMEFDKDGAEYRRL